MGAPVIPYVQQSWSDGSSQCNAARNGVHEDGIRDAHYMPAVRVYHNATQSITSATLTTLAFNSERFDQAGNAADTMHDTSSNNSRLTCRYGGIYQISANITWASDPSDTILEVRLNAGSIILGQLAMNENTANVNFVTQSLTTLASLAVNDFVEVRVRQNSGGAVNISASSSTVHYGCDFMMVRVA